jgi:acyl-CoA-binding protein
MSSEDNMFNLAANYIQSHHQEFSKDHLLKFYGLYKQALFGSNDPAKNPKPSFFRLNDRAKWEAWNSLSGISQESAKNEYLNVLTRLRSDWYDPSSEENNDKSKQSFGVSVSRMRTGDDDLLDDADKTIEDFVREGNVGKFKELLSSIDDLNEIDEESGLALIHWACDRGNESILELILSQPGINIDLKDNESQTALHYAASCGHKNCMKLLLQNGADRNILDDDGNSCLDVAFDEEIKKMLC